MRLEDKSVLLISNAESITETDNTLTSFSGFIPTNFLNQYKSWKVAVHSCGMHMMLKQPISPRYENLPSVIQITFKNLNIAISKYGLADMKQFKLGMLENSLKLFVDREKSYTSKTLVDEFKTQISTDQLYYRKSFDGIPMKYDEEADKIVFGQFENDGTDSEERISKLPQGSKRDVRTFVFMNEYFKEGLDVQYNGRTDFNTTYIDGELYYYFFNSKVWKSKNFYPFESRKRNFPIREPEIIQITSPNIEHNINNGVFRQSLSQFTVKKSDIKKYIHKEFDNYEFFDVLNNCIKGFEIKFVDENLQQIRLSQGLPSWVKLIFMSTMEHKENIRISSRPNDLHPENNMSRFCVELPKPLNFTWKKNPRVALTRVSFKNKWKLMPGLNINLFVYNTEKNNYYNFECPREPGGPRSCEEITNWFQELTKDKMSVRMMKQQLTGNLSFRFTKKSLFILGRDLAQCLGISFAYKNRGDLFIHVKKDVYFRCAKDVPLND